jgi:hypothetical protein
VICKCHDARFDVTTGRMVSPPALNDLPVYPVRIEAGDILIGSTPRAPCWVPQRAMTRCPRIPSLGHGTTIDAPWQLGQRILEAAEAVLIGGRRVPSRGRRSASDSGLPARQPHEEYLLKYARPGSRAIILGMNPGPWGIAQTGVPFGEVVTVRDWLGIGGVIETPPRWHRRLPVTGFDCPRSEVSGRRLRGLMKERYGTALALSRDLFVPHCMPIAAPSPYRLRHHVPLACSPCSPMACARPSFMPSIRREAIATYQ